MNYTNLFEITTDLQIYLSIRTGSPKTLDMFPSIAKTRFTWFVDNWKDLYPRFKASTGGDQNIEAALVEFDRAISSYNLGSNQNPLENNEKFIVFLPFIKQISLNELILNPEEINYINTEISRVSKFTITEFKQMIDFIRQQSAISASLIGKGDPDSLKLFGVQPGRKQRNSTFEDFLQLERVDKLKQYIEGIVFDLKQTEDITPNLLAFSNQNIDQTSQVSVNAAYLSYKTVPFLISLEDMAQKHLGDKTKWYELVTVNNLQPPYIDESGEKFELIAPGGKNSVTIDDTRTVDIPVGQKIRIGSLKFREETRVIERKIDNGDGTITLYLSGIQNLTDLKPSELAYVRIFKPHTVNTGSFILIPTDVRSPLPNSPTPSRDELRRLDKALLAFGVDIKRNLATNDIATDASGNFQYSAGIDNVRQAIYYALRTSQGELPFHPDTYGLQFKIGDKYMGTLDDTVIFAESLVNSLQRDSRFQRITIDGIKVTGNSISLDMTVFILGTNMPMPLSFVA